MHTKHLLIVISISVLGFSLWARLPTKGDENVRQVISLAPTKKTHYIAPQKIPLPKTDIPVQDENEFVDIESEFEKEPVLFTEKQAEKHTLFQGNSDITDDDTEDNDAGNKGFPNDFPNTYFDHHAEAYSNYSETFINEYGERFDTVDYNIEK